MANFPGNPYATGASYGLGPDGAAITRAIMLLAFEVRTANLIEAARPVSFECLTESQRSRSIAALSEARQRLGRPSPEPEGPLRIVITIPDDDPDLDPVARAEIGREVLHAVEKSQGIYPVEVR